MPNPLPYLIAVILTGAPAIAQTSASGDETAVRDLVDKYVAAREELNPQAIQALFTPDADQLVSSGEWRRGRAAVVRGTLASSRQTGGKRAIYIDTVRFLDSGTAIADGNYKLTGLAAGATRDMITTFILKRTPEGWRIAAIRNMLPAPPAPSH